MGNILYLRGNVVALAREGRFDVIAQGCNCFCTQGAGLAKSMSQAFETNNPVYFSLEHASHKGDFNKLGQIQSAKRPTSYNQLTNRFEKDLIVVNCYTQYYYSYESKPFDYDAFTLCMRKINNKFKGLHIGMPMIGTHLAGGDWALIEPIILRELKDMEITIVEYDG